MKKVFGVILILIYSLLFFVVLTVFSENDRYNIYSNFGFNDQYDNASLYFNDPLQEDEKLDVIKIVDEIVKENEVAVVVSNYIEENDQIVGVKNYVSGKDHFISEMLPKSTQLEQDFYEGKQYVSNNFEEDDDKVDLFTFYKGLTYEVIPFHYLEENLDALKYDLIFYFNAKDRKLVENIIEKEFSDLNISIGTMSSDPYNRNEELEKSIKYISVIAFIIFVLFILFTISYNIKDIAILKLNGFKGKDILTYTFKSDVLYSVLFAIIIPITLSALVLRTFSPRLIEFNGINIMVGFLLVAIFIVLIVLSTIVISRYRLSDFIKNKNINAMLTKMTYGLLILTTIVILPMLQQPMNELFETVQAYVEIKANENKIEHIHQVQFNEESRNWEFDLFAYLKKEPNANNQRQITIYDDLAEMDAIYHFRPTVLSPQSVDFEEQEEYLYAGYDVNGKYIEDSGFSMKGKPIEIVDGGHLNILMDEQTFKSFDWQKNDFVSNDEEATIYIFDSSDYLKIENTQIEGYNNKEAPIFLHTENENLFIKDLSSGTFYIDDRKMTEINQYLSSVELENEMIFYKINDRSSQYTEDIMDYLLDTSIQVLPGLISLFAVFISFTNFHSLEKNREIKILKSLGYKTLAISKKYIREVVLLNAIFIGYSFMTTEMVDWRLFFYLFILSILMVLLYIRKIHQAQINKI